MRHLLLLIIIAIIAPAAVLGQTQLEALVSKKDTAGLKAFVLKSDIHFAIDWTLKEANIEEIDHFENGYVLTWTKTISNIVYLRFYVFNLHSKFVSAHEERFLRDTLLSQGPVEFKNKAIQYILQVIINKKNLKKTNGYWDYEVDGYSYEIYNSGKLACIYKTIHLNHYYMLFEKLNKDKIELTQGNDCLRIKK